MKNIAVSGKIGSGKSVLADQLKKEKNYRILSIGNMIKKTCALLIEDREAFNAYARKMVSDGKKSKELIQGIGSHFTTFYSISSFEKDKNGSYVKNDSFRELTQWVATAFREMMGEDIWVTFVAKEAESLLKQNIPVICDDLRFPTEKSILETYGFLSIRLDVSEKVQQQRIKARGDGVISPEKLHHISETALDDAVFDYKISTDYLTEEEVKETVFRYVEKEGKKQKRKSWDEFFLGIAENYAEMGTCTRLKVGAVIVKDKKQVGQGFNGSIHGHDHCEDEGCLINEEGRCIRTLHAEENAVLQTERHLLNGATVYVTHEPCEKCSKTLAQVGIKRIVFREAYSNKWNEHFLRDIEVIHLPKEK